MRIQVNVSKTFRRRFWIVLPMLLALLWVSGVEPLRVCAASALVFGIPIGLAIGGHEAAHAWAAYFLGDRKPVDDGRGALDPLAHFDPLGMLLLPSVLLALGLPGVGYARPVVLTRGALVGWRLAALAEAGPAANALMAALCWGGMRAALGLGPDEAWLALAAAFRVGLTVNLMLCAFNLLPVPPLDGGKAVASFLPERIRSFVLEYELLGFCLVLGMAKAGWLTPYLALADNIFK